MHQNKEIRMKYMVGALAILLIAIVGIIVYFAMSDNEPETPPPSPYMQLEIQDNAVKLKAGK